MNRGVYTTLPYKLVTLQNASGGLGELLDGPGGGVGAFTRVSFTVNSQVDVDGAMVQAVAFPEVAPGVVSTMINPRVFANFVGAVGTWDDGARTYTFVGQNASGEAQTVVLTLDSPTIMVNGQAQDIATLANQPMLAGRIAPVVLNGRQYVPARVLANIFNVPIEFQAPGTVILG
jgi:hypothetical protein